MYPRAPKSMMPQEGDITTLRHCNFCGHSLAEYRGVLESNAKIETQPETITPTAAQVGATISSNQSNELFFCNYEHQADFHAGRTYK